MVRTVVDRDLDVDHRIARDDAVVHSLAHAVLDRVDELLRNDTADNLVLECEAFARLLRRELEPAMTILAMTARLTDKLAFRLCRLADRFAVRNLRIADIAVDLEFAQHAVNDDFQMKLAHARDDRLTRLLVRAHTERRIFFRQLLQGDAHLLLIVLRLRLDRNRNDWVGELHRFKNDRF